MMTHRPATRTTSSTLKKFSVSDRDILDRRVKTNPRYAAVQSRTNTGFNTHRRQELDREIRKYYKVRNDEEFRRISLGDLIQLMVTHTIDTAAEEQEQKGEEEVEEERRGRQEEGEEEEEEEEEEQQEQQEDKGKRERFPLKCRNELQKVVHGMEDLMVRGGRSPPPPPYLILDIRPPQEFTAGHLTTAVNHPAQRLSRAVGWECGPLLAHKNRPGAVIVVCDEGEDAAPAAVSILQHRGYSNVLLLSGGIRLARDKIGHPLVTTESSASELPLCSALTLQNQLAATVLPPLSVADAAQWWAASTTATAATAHTTHRSLDPPAPPRPRPWR